MATENLKRTHSPGATAGATRTATSREGGGSGNGVNVGTMERWVSLLSGGALIAGGLKKGGVGGIVTALLGGALAQRGATGHCQLYGALGLDTAKGDERDRGLGGLVGGTQEVRVHSVATVQRPATELYRVWHDPTNLPRFMSSVQSVERETEHRARWTLKPPMGPTIDFVAEVTDEVPGEFIAWRSADTTLFRHTGEVRFEEMPNDRGTVVRVKLEFQPPAGGVGAGIAKLFDEAMALKLRGDLKNFKQLMETGEVATIEGQTSGRKG